MHRPLRVLAVVAATLISGLVAGPATAVTTTDVNPPTLPRGADVSIPHLEGKTIVDGSTRVRVTAPVVRLLGKSGAAYIVGTARRDGTGGKLFRYEADATFDQLFRASIYMTRLADNGQTLVLVRHRGDDKTVVRVRSASTGDSVDERTFRGYPDVLDIEGTQVCWAASTPAPASGRPAPTRSRG